MHQAKKKAKKPSKSETKPRNLNEEIRFTHSAVK